jgi:hypothetical protein
MAVGIVALDFFVRLAVVEKRVAERWLCIAENERPTEENGYVSEQPPYGTITNRTRSVTIISTGTFALGKLLRQPRILISLWAVIVGALVVSAFDAVCDLCDVHGLPLMLYTDSANLRREYISLECSRCRYDLLTWRCSCNLPTILR